MKTLLITLSLLLSVNLFSDELKWVDEQIEAIKPPRSGVDESKVNATVDPFLFLGKKSLSSTTAASKSSSGYKSSSASKAKVYRKGKSLTLKAILNKSALINNKWYKINEKVGKYIISDIDKTTVTLKYGKSKLFLSTNSINKNLKFKNK